MKAPKNIDTYQVDDVIDFAGLFLPIDANTSVKGRLVVKSENELEFELTYMGIYLCDVFAIKRDGIWHWEV